MNPDLERLIGRAVVDQKFRDSLLTDLEGTIKKSGLNLTEDEIKDVKESLEEFKSQSASGRLDELLGPDEAKPW